MGIAPLNVSAGHLKIYPNPSDGIFYLSLPELKNGFSEISVTDVLGNAIWKESLNNSGAATIDLTFIPNGIYFLKVASDSKSVSKRIVLCK